MLTFDNGGRLVQSTSELPHLQGARNIFVDFETTSGDPALKATDPWHHCGVAGIAVTVDDAAGAWYVPIGHNDSSVNLPSANVEDWWFDILSAAQQWTNHNVKFDAHVSTNALGVMPECPLYDTLTMAKIVDSDRMLRGGYGLEALAAAWLREDISGYNQALQPYLHKNKDYGRVPADVLGEYACQDVLSERRLFDYIEAHTHEQCRDVQRTELAMTRLLFQVEQEGMHVDPQELMVTEYKILRRLQQLDEQLEAVVGRAFRPHVNNDCFDVLCNQYGLPVLAYTDTGNPSFDKAALVQYSHHPHAPPKVVELMLEYRTLSTLLGFFVQPYQRLQVDGVLHPTYNQAVRTGRMSCSNPNAQQLSPAAKRLIHPPPGHSFISTDASQIEFRVIVHYIQNEAAIRSYNEDPDTDFHTWVADMCEMARKPAKSVNFMMGYGGGQKKCVSMLASNMEIVGQLQTEVDALVAAGKVEPSHADLMFEMLCEERAKKVYRRYHDTLPELRITTRRASNALKKRGYVYNGYGRHRHLPIDASFKAFNALCQSFAADMVKERMVALAEQLENTPVKIVGQVHDEIVLTCPTELIDDALLDGITNVLEWPSCAIRVPIRWDIGHSSRDWLEASKNGVKRPYRPAGSCTIDA